MEELQQYFTQWVTSAAALIPLGYAFGAGMVSAVNPCGFAMLPAYLGLFLGSRDLVTVSSSGGYVADTAVANVDVASEVARAVLVTAAVTAGFVLLFGGVGILISAAGQLIVSLVPWVALGIGGVLVLLGISMLLGRHVSAGFAARIAARIGNPGTVGLKGFFVFGVAYAVASLSCTLPIFLTVVGGSLAASSFGTSVVQFISYALGMGLIVLLLTMGIAVFKGAVVGMLRQAVPYVERVSAALLIVAGTYIVYYWLIKGRLIDSFL